MVRNKTNSKERVMFKKWSVYLSLLQQELLWPQNLLLWLTLIFVWNLLLLTGLDQEMLLSQVLLIITMPIKILFHFCLEPASVDWS